MGAGGSLAPSPQTRILQLTTLPPPSRCTHRLALQGFQGHGLMPLVVFRLEYHCDLTAGSVRSPIMPVPFRCRRFSPGSVLSLYLITTHKQYVASKHHSLAYHRNMTAPKNLIWSSGTRIDSRPTFWQLFLPNTRERWPSISYWRRR